MTNYHRAALALLTGRPVRARDLGGGVALLIGAAEQARRVARRRGEPYPGDWVAMARWAAGKADHEEATR